MSDTPHLTSSDVAKLLQDPSSENRATAAEKVGAQFGMGSLSAEERSIAEDIFRIMVKDAEVRVRQALSESLKSNPEVPRDVAMTLAKDVVDVAAPMLQFSAALTEQDLIDIVETQDSDHQKSVALREHVSEAVSDRLADVGNEDVVATLVANEGADISESTMNKVLDEFGDSERINTPMVQRNKLPLTVAERLVTLVSDSLREHLVTHHDLPMDVASDLVLESRERATVSLLGAGDSRGDVVALVDELFNNGRLTPTLILRAICMGDVVFFEAALARLAEIPVQNAYQLVHDKGGIGLDRLFKKIELSDDMLKIAKVALSVAEEVTLSGGRDDREQYRKIVIERILTQFEDDFDDAENLDYFIGKLGVAAQTAA